MPPKVCAAGGDFEVDENGEIDVDGDGAPDIDVDRIAYLGASLGGIMGAELLALSPHVRAAVLTVAGGRLASILQDGNQFSIVLDFVVPVTTLVLARALGTPHLPPVLRDAGLLPKEAELPMSGNLEEGSLTAGLFQFDRVTLRPGGRPEAAQHNNTVSSMEMGNQAFRFLESWIEDDVPEVIDPYELLGTRPLP